MTLNSTGCQMSIVKSVMNVVINSIHSGVAITVVSVDKYFVTDAVVRRYLAKLLGFLVSGRS